MSEILGDIQYGFAVTIGPWLAWGFALVVFGGISEVVVGLFHRPVTKVKIESQDDVY